jgi:uncharacterized membrane protein YphA (DoxX/SURF4 family)
VVNQGFQKRAVLALRWSLGVVVIVQSLRFALEPAAAHYFAQRLPFWLRPGLAWTEIAAAVLFLMPLTARWGGYLLMLVFLLAGLLHVLHGEFDIGPLVVYAAAVLVTLAYRDNALQSSYDRR